MSPAVLFGLALLVLFWAWIFYFFARVRPCIMNALGRKLGVKVAESTDFVDAGTYDVKDERAPVRKSVAVMAADLVVLLLGTVGVAALIFIPAFVVAERGTLLPLEAKLTGRGATLRIVGFGGLAKETGTGRFTLAAENAGETPLVNCLVTVDSYTARNGYLHGVSRPFDLEIGEARTVALDVEATNPPAGENRFRLELECSADRLAVASGTFQAR